MTGRRERRLLLALFLLALLLRCGFSLVYGLGAPPERWGDDAEYDAIASHLVFDHQYHNNWFPPGYPFFLAMIYSLFGHSYVAVRLIQAALGAAACCVLYLVGRDTFSPPIGWFGALALALWPGHIYLSWRLMSETLFTLLIALAVAAARPLLARCWRREGELDGAGRKAAGRQAVNREEAARIESGGIESGGIEDGREWAGGEKSGPQEARRADPADHPIRLAAVLGLALGAATLVKSNLLAFAVLVIGWLLVAGLTRAILARSAGRGAGLWRSCAPGAVTLAAFLLVLLANPLANRLSLTTGGESGPVALTPGNAGPTLWWSNNPLADGYFVDPDNTTAGRSFIARHGMAQAIKDPNPFVRDAAQRRLALAWMRENPGDFCVLVLRKLWNAYGPTPHAAVLLQSPLAQFLQLVTWSALLPAALAGIALARRRWRAALPLYLVLAASVFTTVVFYGTPRFTLPVAPYLLVFAGYSLHALHAAVLQLRARRRADDSARSASAPPQATRSSGVLPQPRIL